MTNTNGYIGKQLGNYRIIKKLGKGGFGEVYLGEHIHLSSLAAIKLLLNAADQDAFLKEAQILSRLKHANIVRILEFGIDGEVPFLIMDYAPKGTLRQHHAEGTCLSLENTIYYVKQVAAALQHAHNQKLIHRDVKPENILLGENDELLLSDFGLAVGANSTRSQEIEKIAGTLAYAAPEQFVGKAFPASDQYALGIITYEWLCGHRPFYGSASDLKIQHATAAPDSLRERVPTIPLEVEEVVMKALAKDPQDRFPNIQVFATALEQAALGQTVPPEPSPTRTQTLEEQISPAPPNNSFKQIWAEVIQAQARGDNKQTFRLLLEIWWMENLTPSQRDLVKKQIQSSPQMLSWCIQQARKASTKASIEKDWQVEIQMWETLLAVGSSQQKITEQLTLAPIWNMGNAIQERLRIAQQNEQYAWMYSLAEEFVDKQNNAAARKQLKALWTQAPFYGDAAGLAHIVGLPPADNYEQALAKELVRLQRLRDEEERKRLEEEKRLQMQRAKEERERQVNLVLMQKQEEKEEQQRQVEAARQKRQEMIRIIAAEVWPGIGVGSLAGVLLTLLSGITRLSLLPWVWKTYASHVTPDQINTGKLILGLEKVLAVFVNFPEWVSGILVGALVGLIIGAIVGYIESLLKSNSFFLNGLVAGGTVGLLTGAILLGAIGGLIFGYLVAIIGLFIGAYMGMKVGATIAGTIGRQWD